MRDWAFERECSLAAQNSKLARQLADVHKYVITIRMCTPEDSFKLYSIYSQYFKTFVVVFGLRK